MITITIVSILAIAQAGDTTSAVKKIVAESSAKLLAAKAITGEYVGPMSCEFFLQKPMMFRVIGPTFEFYSDGKTHWTHLVGEKEYLKFPVKDRGLVGLPTGFGPFFGVETSHELPYIINLTEHVFQKLGSRSVATVVYHFESFGRDDKLSLFIDPETKLPIGWDQLFGGTKASYRFRNVRLVDPAPPETFHWKVPEGVKERIVRRQP